MDREDLIKYIDRISLTGPGGMDKLKRALLEIIESGGAGEVTEWELQEALASKQDLLVSGESIKTINNISILGTGNVVLPKGEKGEPGPKGDKGDRGERGPSGKGISSVVATATQDSTKPPMSVNARVVDDTDSITVLLDFYNIKGDKGNTGERGPAGVESVQVNVDSLSGTPRAVASISNNVLSISFYGLKGQQGDPGTSHARQSVVTVLPTASAETIDIVYLVQIGNTDEYERYITQFDGTNYSWLQIGTTEMTMDDYIRKDDILFFAEDDYEDIEVFDSSKYYVTYEDEEI